MGRPTKHQKRYKFVGRPTKVTKEVLQKLEDAFSNDFTDKEACFYSNIAPRTLYYYQENNPEFVQRKEELKMSPNLMAKRTVISTLNNPQDAWRWLSRRDDAFKPVSKIEHSGKLQTEPSEMTPAFAAALKVYLEQKNKEIDEKAKEA